MDIVEILMICNAYIDGYTNGINNLPLDNNPWPENSVGFIAFAYGHSNSLEDRITNTPFNDTVH